ncbi:MAG TPA: SDR family NAD(P)-dependent oxidoreductase [Candidatus Thermoplasmatota archaeon]|nr:SDR family NAD(P)-dependent oxidoreductase [Candidatus Thermoplasmatota archaeon]
MRLSQHVCLVTGATRGVGKAVAVELGREGATVVATGRSVRGATTEGLPGSVEETAEAVTAAGGKGIASRCDHAKGPEVRALFDRVLREHGRLDLVVANAWGGYEGYDPAESALPFWEQPFEKRWRGMFENGLRAQLLAAQHAARTMSPRGRGLVVSTLAWDEGKPLGALHYDVAKAAAARAVHGMARELRPHGVAAVGVSPGFVRTERVLAEHARRPLDLSQTESPRYAARAVAALAADKDVMAISGEVLHVGDLARRYGFRDDDGRQPRFRLP